MSKKITTEEFIKRAVAKHGNKYDYSKSIYINNSTNLEIYCKVCDNTFYQTPANHNHKSKRGGCSYCSGKIKTTESLIKQAQKIHGDKYDYSKIVYVGVHDKIIVGCKEHGWFKVTPSNFTHKKNPRGCLLCGIKKTSDSKIIKFDEFLKRCKDKYGDKFKYDIKDYNGIKSNMKITCKIHGDFEMLASNHLRGKSGCKKCFRSKL